MLIIVLRARLSFETKTKLDVQHKSFLGQSATNYAIERACVCAGGFTLIKINSIKLSITGVDIERE